MIDGESHRRLGLIAQRWRDLAESRRADFTQLYDSGRWTRYYSEDRFVARMREVVASAEAWNSIAAGFAPADPAPAAQEPS